MGYLRMEGKQSFTIGYSKVKLRIERIVNNHTTKQSYPLSIRLYAKESLATNSKAYLFAKSDISPLSALSEITAFERSVIIHKIPNGYFYPAITLSEQNPDSPTGWAVVDICQFDELIYFGKRITVNDGSFIISNNTLNIKIHSINNETQENTGELRVKIVLTKVPYTDGPVKGLQIGVVEIDSLSSEQTHKHIEWQFEQIENAAKNNYGLVFIEEKVDGTWLPRDHYSSEIISNPSEIKPVLSANKDDNPMKELEEMVGLVSVKESIKELEGWASFREKKLRLNLGDEEPITLHMCFKGPPGTGKTTVARIIGHILYKYGLLSKDKYSEVKRSDLVSGYTGQSVHMTRKVIEDALHGVLFIDEAHSLSEGNVNGGVQDYGAEVINELISSMETYRDKLCIILAGYSEEMDRFLNYNPGMKNRIPRIIDFPDYHEDELWKIFEYMVSKQKMSCDQSIKPYFKIYMRKLQFSQVPGKFGNAREVRNTLERAKLSLVRRITRISEPSIKQMTTLISEDFDFMVPNQESIASFHLTDPMVELNKLVGLKTVKQEMQKLINWASMIQQRLKQGIETRDQGTMHMCFTGPPGTGKTTVARIVGRILHKYGLVASNKFKEVTRSDLVGEFIGQTGPKTRKVIEEALGGVLFIDEAYSLSEANVHGSSQDYGAEAIAELIPSMENYRDRLCIIYAGYTKEMELLLNLNPGMKSRIAREIKFPDYNQDELWDIFKFIVSERDVSFDYSIEPVFKAYIQLRKSSCEPGRFGNAREVRNIFYRAEEKLASRINIINKPSREELTTLKSCDFEFLSENDQL